MFKNKTLLITGGTGSFGNAVLKRFLHADIKEIRVFSRDEKKQEDMRVFLKHPKLKFIIGDVRHYDSIAMAIQGVDYVFHAAALKQVPSCEFYPMEAIRTNTLGAENVLNAAANYDVEKLIVLSTDKAVYPINAMGMSKALMEKLMLAKARINIGNTIFCGTRYGNVMGSRGSVIPLFISQIKKRKPITITDPQMTRFMMSLDDAVDLVLYAYQNGNQGDRFVQKAPAATIETLAQALIELFQSDTEIRIIGTRHGEKQHETLLTREEKAIAQDCDNYYRIPADTRDLNYNKYFVDGEERISKAEDYNSSNTYRLNVQETKDLLSKLNFVQQALNQND
ncbi:MAG: polysaccharide biosynthesis protein [candidate division KSB1 bacterium]|nr:polysaccharide biosynthesis protein [candidate division KSB1 bacterium]